MYSRTLFITISFLLAGVAGAQENGNPPVETLDLTMKLMPEGASLPAAVTRVIELPPAVVDAARENSAAGIGEANAARENRQNGLDRALEAGERGRERAQEAREDRGRGPADGDPPGPPDDLPGDPPGGPPDTPAGPPGN